MTKVEIPYSGIKRFVNGVSLAYRHPGINGQDIAGLTFINPS
jgi:hypothetical protein